MPIVPPDATPPAPPANTLQTHQVLSANAQAGPGDTDFLISPEKILQTFLELVRIPSPSGQEEKVRNYLEARLQSLGISKQDALLPDQANYIVDPVGSLIIYLPSNAQSTQTLLMNAHMDVVPPCLNIRPVIKIDPALSGENRVVYSSGDTVLGGDDKSALAPMLEALSDSLAHNRPRPNLIITWTAQEELGAAGAARMDSRWYAQKPFRADLALSFDINGEQGTVVYQAPQLTLWHADVHGKSAHAGIEPEKGVNALKAAIVSANQIPLGRLDSETTVNIGKIQSGEKFNIVPGSAQVSGEVRSFNPVRVGQELENIQRAFTAGTQKVPGTRYTWEQQTLFNAYRTNLDLPIFEPLKAAFKETKLPLNPIRTTGGSDANVFAAHGIPSVVLSGAYNNPHQNDEFVRVRDMATQAQLILNIWQQYARH
jgi:tripeptide aminopeptidase